MLSEIQSLHNESDVEQKLIFPLLTLPEPQGLEYPESQIRTKPDIRQFYIGKGKEKKLYFPDYIVLASGHPVLLIEAKGPGEDLEEAYREARLYVTELNAQYKADFNPLTRIICTNGNLLIAGRWDTNQYEHSLSIDKLQVGNPEFATFVSSYSNSTLLKEIEAFLDTLVERPFHMPIRLIGGQAIQNAEIGRNGFGNTLALEYRHLFNPSSRKERVNIVSNAYVSSKHRERYIDPIDRIIRAALPSSRADSKLIANVDNPRELLSILSRGKELEQQVLLLIGGVGTGKSTFIDYLRAVKLPDDLVKTTNWVHINMNRAPINPEAIYQWIADEIVSALQQDYSDIDFEELEIIQRVFSVELNRQRKGPLKLLTPRSEAYNTRLADAITNLQNDWKASANAHIRYLCAERGKLLIIVLDNCDKRLRDEQLLMFEVAQWLQGEFRCLVILPLREETYNNHRAEPPLDTALKDLVFRIEPPPFHRVLQERVNLMIKEMRERDNGRNFSFDLPNGVRVTFTLEEQTKYLNTLLKSLFLHNNFIKNMIVGLSGRNLRQAMEIFIDLCTSGYIGEDEIFRIRQAEGDYSIPFHVICRVLLRLNRRYYNGDDSYIKNLFQADPQDANPNHFVRLAILRWLQDRFQMEGPSSVKGFFPLRNIKADLTLLGVNEQVIHRELIYLLKSRCIIAEHLGNDKVVDDDLVCLAPAGFVHLDLVEKVDYFAAIAEDTWFDREAEARQIAHRIGSDSHLKINAQARNAETVVNYLKDKLENALPHPEGFLLNSPSERLLDFSKSVEGVNKFLRMRAAKDPWFAVNERYQIGQVVTGVVRRNHPELGVFIEIEPGIDGLAHKRGFSNQGFEEGLVYDQRISVKILDIQDLRERMSLKVVFDGYA